MASPTLSDLPRFLVVETFFYFFFGLVALFVVGYLAAIAVVALGAFRGPKWIASTLTSVLTLLSLALVFGAPANAVFVMALRYRYYVPGDPAVDWLPFVPSATWVIDPSLGGRFINGGSPTLLVVGWLVLAIPVWGLAWRSRSRVQGWLAEHTSQLASALRPVG